MLVTKDKSYKLVSTVMASFTCILYGSVATHAHIGLIPILCFLAWENTMFSVIYADPFAYSVEN